MSSANTNDSLQFPYDHIVIVVLENHSYSEIIGSASAPYINNTLVEGGVLINNAFGEQHPSQPNYFWLFSGSNQGINYDHSYWPSNSPGPVFDAPNLYTALESTVGQQQPNFFGGYVDSGTTTPVTNYYQDTNNYANRHVPWLGFTNINNGKPAAITKDFGTQFPTSNYSTLPLVSFVIPGLDHDMHDYDSSGHGVTDPTTSAIAIQNGDTWLQTNLDGYAQWAKDNNSLLIITFDEDSTADWVTPVEWGGNGTDENPEGMTAPTLSFNAGTGNSATWPAEDNLASGPNQIAMIFYGANLSCTGPFTVTGAGVNNINLLRTIESFYQLPQSGAQTPLASAAGLTDGPITGFFTF